MAKERLSSILTRIHGDTAAQRHPGTPQRMSRPKQGHRNVFSSVGPRQTRPRNRQNANQEVSSRTKPKSRYFNASGDSHRDLTPWPKFGCRPIGRAQTRNGKPKYCGMEHRSAGTSEGLRPARNGQARPGSADVDGPVSPPLSNSSPSPGPAEPMRENSQVRCEPADRLHQTIRPRWPKLGNLCEGVRVVEGVEVKGTGPTESEVQLGREKLAFRESMETAIPRHPALAPRSDPISPSSFLRKLSESRGTLRNKLYAKVRKLWRKATSARGKDHSSPHRRRFLFYDSTLCGSYSSSKPAILLRGRSSDAYTTTMEEHEPVYYFVVDDGSARMNIPLLILVVRERWQNAWYPSLLCTLRTARFWFIQIGTIVLAVPVLIAWELCALTGLLCIRIYEVGRELKRRRALWNLRDRMEWIVRSGCVGLLLGVCINLANECLRRR